MHKNVVKGATSSYRYHVPSMKSVTIPPHVHPLTAINTCNVMTLGFLFPLKTLDPPQTALPLCVTAERVTYLSASTKEPAHSLRAIGESTPRVNIGDLRNSDPASLGQRDLFGMWLVQLALIFLGMGFIWHRSPPILSLLQIQGSKVVFPLKVLNSTLRHTALWSYALKLRFEQHFQVTSNQTVGLLQVEEFIFFLSSFFSFFFQWNWSFYFFLC